jgi:hypothetical protein
MSASLSRFKQEFDYVLAEVLFHLSRGEEGHAVFTSGVADDEKWALP